MLAAIAVVASLFAGCIVVQVFLAGLGVFEGPARFESHRDFGYLFGWLTLILLVLSAIARVRRLVLLSILALVQFALQSVFIAMRADYPAVAALHPVNGVLLLLVAIAIARDAWRRSAARQPMPSSADAAAATASAPEAATAP
jgi:hypothetical protein